MVAFCAMACPEPSTIGMPTAFDGPVKADKGAATAWIEVLPDTLGARSLLDTADIIRTPKPGGKRSALASRGSAQRDPDCLSVRQSKPGKKKLTKR